MASLKRLRVTVDGRAFDVTVEVLDESGAAPRLPSPAQAAIAPADDAPVPIPAAAAPGAVPSPLAGKVVSIDVRPGQVVPAGAPLLILEAMKMNTFVHAPQAGTVGAILVQPGDAVEEGAPLLMLA